MKTLYVGSVLINALNVPPPHPPSPKCAKFAQYLGGHPPQICANSDCLGLKAQPIRVCTILRRGGGLAISECWWRW